MWPPNQSLPTPFGPQALHTRGTQLCPTEFQRKGGFKAQSSLSVSRYGFDEVDTDGKEFRVCGPCFHALLQDISLLATQWPQWGSDQRQQTELNSCSTKEYKVWTLQTPVPPYWAQQLWTGGSRWTNGTVRKAQHICTTSFQTHHGRLATNVFETFPIWNIDENIQTARGNKLITKPVSLEGIFIQIVFKENVKRLIIMTMPWIKCFYMY